jgi:signal transduction histidine kinase
VDGLFPPQTEISIYRIVQEGLNNAVKHASATSVSLTVRRNGGVVQIRLSDDGRGFEPNQRDGFGLTGIKERVQLLGGRMNINSALGQGTCLRVEIPVPAKPKRA